MYLLKELDELYNKFADKAYEPNVLDGKTKELIAIVCSVMADCVPCIEYHYKKAVEYGANEEEIMDALGITMSVSAGSKRAKYIKLITDLRISDKKGRNS